jgi:hypothetical protein
MDGQFVPSSDKKIGSKPAVALNRLASPPKLTLHPSFGTWQVAHVLALLPSGLKNAFVTSGRPDGAFPQSPVRSEKVPLAGEGAGGALCATTQNGATRPHTTATSLCDIRLANFVDMGFSVFAAERDSTLTDLSVIGSIAERVLIHNSAYRGLLMLNRWGRFGTTATVRSIELGGFLNGRFIFP